VELATLLLGVDLTGSVGLLLLLVGVGFALYVSVVLIAGCRVAAFVLVRGLSLDWVVGVAVEGRVGCRHRARVLSPWHSGVWWALAGLVELAPVLGVAVGDGDVVAGTATSRSSDPPWLLMAEPP
jgi:hypothetical protein